MNQKTQAELALSNIHGIGPAMVRKLAEYGIEDLKDLLFHLPLRYEDRTRIMPLGQLKPGQRAVVVGKVEYSEIQFRGRRTLVVYISDDRGDQLTLRFFHFSRSQHEQFQPGKIVRCYGEARSSAYGLNIVHPEYQFVTKSELEHIDQASENTYTPVYPTTEGIGQGRWRFWIKTALNELDSLNIPELLPDALLQQYGLVDVKASLHLLHHPPDSLDLTELNSGRHPAIQRLVIEELFAHQISLRQLRKTQKTENAPALSAVENPYENMFVEQLGFELTQAQQRVIQEIKRDLEIAQPMLRLLQGDVGSGKTVVAAIAALQSIKAGFQVALMAPTEILAEQHLNNFRNWFMPLGLDVSWLSGKQKKSERTLNLDKLKNNESQIVVGTHALFQEGVKFERLGLCIIDEQHKFGVHQRLALREKGSPEFGVPHQLVMTATPIPRTLAMSAYADLDVSVIDELPPGRKPAQTVVLAESSRHKVLERIHEYVAQGRQVYWVCPLVEESEHLQCEAAEKTAERMAEYFPELKVALIHGRLNKQQKNLVMQAFKLGDVDLLVATTVIEVGVDVPNANLMVIENAERMGLSQLHQLRGRIGRGGEESFCVLLYKAPLSEHASLRLQTMRQTTDGFRIAEKDLEIRGPGELLGTRQTGIMQMRIANIMRDAKLIPGLQAAADELIEQNPQHARALVKRWLGDKLRYGQV